MLKMKISKACSFESASSCQAYSTGLCSLQIIREHDDDRCISPESGASSVHSTLLIWLFGDTANAFYEAAQGLTHHSR